MIFITYFRPKGPQNFQSLCKRLYSIVDIKMCLVSGAELANTNDQSPTAQNHTLRYLHVPAP